MSGLKPPTFIHLLKSYCRSFSVSGIATVTYYSVLLVDIRVILEDATANDFALSSFKLKKTSAMFLSHNRFFRLFSDAVTGLFCIKSEFLGLLFDGVQERMLVGNPLIMFGDLFD